MKKEVGSEQGIISILPRASTTDFPSGVDYSDDLRPCGMGFMLTDTIALTCAHVINSVLGRREQDGVEAPSEKELFEISFPVANRTETRHARVIRWSPPTGDGIDCVVLKLTEPAPENVGRTILTLVRPEDTEDNKLTVYRSRARDDPGAHVPARLMGEVGAQWNHLEVQGKLFIQNGFSGAAVWNHQQRAAVGMLVARDRDSAGASAYFLPSERIAERFGDAIPYEVRKLRLKRQFSFSWISVLLFFFVLVHFLATQGSASLHLVPWADGSKTQAAFFGAHFFPIFLGPFVMWYAQMHARSLALRKWWQRVPTLFSGARAAMLDNTRIGAFATTLFLLILPAYGQGLMLDKVFFADRKIVVNVDRFDDLNSDDCIWEMPGDEKWCTVEGVGVASFVLSLTYFNHVYQIVNDCQNDHFQNDNCQNDNCQNDHCQNEHCQAVTFFPLLHPLVLFGATLLGYFWFFVFMYALVRPYPYRLDDL